MTCSICGLVLQGYNAMARHKLNDHSSLKDFLCQQCGQGFKAKSYLRKHVLMSHTAPSDRPFPCTLCPKGFYRGTRLKDHMNGVHNKVKPFACRDGACTVAFATYNECKRHERRQHNLFIKSMFRNRDGSTIAEANLDPAEKQ
jgi:KRAB domain-containing zinc finger protein